jgi:hypothetical protein
MYMVRTFARFTSSLKQSRDGITRTPLVRTSSSNLKFGNLGNSMAFYHKINVELQTEALQL